MNYSLSCYLSHTHINITILVIKEIMVLRIIIINYLNLNRIYSLFVPFYSICPFFHMFKSNDNDFAIYRRTSVTVHFHKNIIGKRKLLLIKMFLHLDKIKYFSFLIIYDIGI